MPDVKALLDCIQKGSAMFSKYADFESAVLKCVCSTHCDHACEPFQMKKSREQMGMDQ